MSLIQSLIKPLILWFKECSYENKNLVGGKCSSLGELYHLSEKINFMLQQCWMPHYCKQKGLRVIDNNLILNAGCKNIKKFHGISLAMPVNYLNGKSKYSKGFLFFFYKVILLNLSL